MKSRSKALTGCSMHGASLPLCLLLDRAPAWCGREFTSVVVVRSKPRPNSKADNFLAQDHSDSTFGIVSVS